MRFGASTRARRAWNHDARARYGCPRFRWLQVSVSTFVRLFVVAALALLSGGSVRAQDKVVVITNWFAQAEHGGIYQALASGLYKKHGLDVTVKMGGPQVNAIQLLAADQADFIMNRDFAVLQGVSKGLPLVTVLAPMQFDAAGPADARGRAGPRIAEGQDDPDREHGAPVLVAVAEEEVRLQRRADASLHRQPAAVLRRQQRRAAGFPTSEPYQVAQKGMKYRFFPFAAEGYPPYHGALVTLQKTIDAKPDMVARFVRATAEGWKSFLADPAPAAVLIKRENPNMTDGEIAFAVQKLKDSQAVTGGDAAQLGIGAMTEARWKKNFDFMVESGLLSPSTEWRKAYTTRFIDDLKVMP